MSISIAKPEYIFTVTTSEKSKYYYTFKIFKTFTGMRRYLNSQEVTCYKRLAAICITWESPKKYELGEIIFYKETVDPNKGYVQHECVHAVMAYFRKRGKSLDFNVFGADTSGKTGQEIEKLRSNDREEEFAYAVQWMVVAITRFLCEHNVLE